MDDVLSYKREPNAHTARDPCPRSPARRGGAGPQRLDDSLVGPSGDTRTPGGRAVWPGLSSFLCWLPASFAHHFAGTLEHEDNSVLNG